MLPDIVTFWHGPMDALRQTCLRSQIAAGHNVTVYSFDTIPGLPAGVANADAEAILCMLTEKIDADLLTRAPRLRVISQMAVGVDNVDLDAASAAGVVVMNTPGGNAVSVAEHTLAMMLAMAAARKNILLELCHCFTRTPFEA